MSIDLTQLNPKVTAIRKAADGMQDLVHAALLRPERALTAAEEAQLRQELDDARHAIADLAVLLGATETTTDFTAFFTGIGDALVRAQQALDTQSEQYLADVRAKPHILPSIFRIPRLTADFKFALENLSHENLSLVFYGRGDQAKQLNQQSIHFEVVAAPPPPGALELPGAPWSLAPLLSPADRGPVFDVVKTAIRQATFPADEATAVQSAVLDDPDAAVLLPGGAPGHFFLAVARVGPPENLGIWHVALSPPTLDTVQSYGNPLVGRPDGPRQLHDTLADVCTRQRDLLKKLAAG